MKHGIFIILIGIAGIIHFGCRSARSSNRNYDSHNETRKESQTVRSDSARTESSHRDSTITTTGTQEYSRITVYNDSGRISSIQEQWRRTGSAQLYVSTGRSSAIFVSEQKTDSTTVSVANITEKIKERSSSDSRPVQGVEWFWVIAGIGLLALIVFIILLRKFKK